MDKELKWSHRWFPARCAGPIYHAVLLPACYCLPNATTHCLALLAKNGGSYPLKFSVTGIWNSIVQFDFHTARFLWIYNHYNNYNHVITNCTTLNRAVPPKWDLPVRARDHFLPSSAVLLPHYVHACEILKYFADFYVVLFVAFVYCCFLLWHLENP